MGNWQGFVVCPRCESALSSGSATISCNFCGSRFDIEGDIPKLICDKELDTKLDLETYAKLASVEPRALQHVHKEFNHAVNAVGLDLNGNMLEVGTGTGLLTEAMLEYGKFSRIISTDVSMAFARYTKDRLARFAANLDFVVCDGNRLPFRQGTFDLVLGRSVLHHLLHYRTTLASALKLLKPGGAAVFMEPVQQGQAYIAFMFRIILEIDATTGSIGLSNEEKRRMKHAIIGMTKIISVSQDLESLSKLEDKFNFDADDLCTEAREVGYASAHFITLPNVDTTYWAYLAMRLRSFGVRPEIIKKVQWLKSAFAETIGGTSGAKLTANTGYFVFVKAQAAARAQIRPLVTDPVAANS